MALIDRKSLLEVGAHFGHKKSKRNPKMKPYIYGERSGVNIIDLEKTISCAAEAYKDMKEFASFGNNILFVGTKKQATESVKKFAEHCGAYYVNNRWLGGTLTNLSVIKRSVSELERLENLNMEELPKKESSRLSKKRDKLFRNLNGIRNMKALPSALFVTDLIKDHIAVTEAQKLNIPVVAIADTDANPDGIYRIIPANDDAVRSLSFFLEFMAKAINEGKGSLAEGDIDANTDAPIEEEVSNTTEEEKGE